MISTLMVPIQMLITGNLSPEVLPLIALTLLVPCWCSRGGLWSVILRGSIDWDFQTSVNKTMIHLWKYDELFDFKT